MHDLNMVGLTFKMIFSCTFGLLLLSLIVINWFLEVFLSHLAFCLVGQNDDHSI